ncbi:MAG TPA: hypothetical protein VKF81_01165 [Blastocatellia bacterium]|nr:hypothetical protein [Blastocatellia bacterium]
MKTRPLITCLLLAFLFVGLSQGQTLHSTKLDCKVLEVSGPYLGSEKELSQVHYAVVHHNNAADRQRFSQLLKAESGTDVLFRRDDGRSHYGVLRRLRMCFGRGLLVFIGPVDLREGEVLTLEVRQAKK